MMNVVQRNYTNSQVWISEHQVIVGVNIRLAVQFVKKNVVQTVHTVFKESSKTQ